MLVNNRWVRASGSLNDKPISIQYRQDWQEGLSSGLYPICVQIAWYAQGVDESTGFPSASEQADILLLSEYLQAHLESKEDSIISMLITHDGLAQWVIYTQDLEQFKTALEAIPAPEHGYPIEVVADEDPGWLTFTQVYGSIAQKEVAEAS